MENEKKKTRFVVTEYGNDWDYNFCTGVYDDYLMAYGKVLTSIIDSMSNNYDDEVKIRLENDHVGNAFIDVICTKPKNETHLELEEGYRIYFLDEEEQQIK